MSVDSPNSRTALLIAFHFPPCGTSSGLQRTLSLAMYLQQFNWRPVVLTVSPMAYERTSDAQLADIPPGITVIRAPALDSARHLAIAGRYWSPLTYPDRWLSWLLSAVPLGINLARRERADVIWSTYPIATAHLVGASIGRATGTPWIADFRDPMVEYFEETGEIFPVDATLRKLRLRIERLTVKHSAHLVFCTERARRIVLDRYDGLAQDGASVISNGYEERSFSDAEASAAHFGAEKRRVLLHSGKVYWGSDRDPTVLMEAIRDLADAGIISPETFELRLRDPSDEAELSRVAERTGVASFVTVAPALPYRDALAEMLSADGLLLLQGFTSNPAVPAKLYEYLRARRPILGLVHPAGESAALLHDVGFSETVDLFDRAGIRKLVGDWFRDEGVANVEIGHAIIESFDRRILTGDLAQVFDRVADDACHARS